MLEKLKRLILKPIYKLIIVRVFLLEKHRLDWYKRIKPHCVLKVQTTHGEFVFNFKRDERTKRRLNDKLFKTVMIGLTVPENTILSMPELPDTIIVVIKIKLKNINYQIFSEVLTDIYLDKILEVSMNKE